MTYCHDWTDAEIQAHIEKLEQKIERYKAEQERRQQEVPLGVPCDGEFYVSWDGVAIEDQEEEASKVNYNSFNSRESAEKHAEMLLTWRKALVANAKGEPIDIEAIRYLLPKGWVAMDALGLWRWYSKKPDQGFGEWKNNSVIPSERLSAFNLKRAKNWETSLMECGL